MDKLKMHSPDMSQENVSKLKTLFPNCVTETKDDEGILKFSVDFDVLKQELSNSLVEGAQERFHLNWPGKKEALINANKPAISPESNELLTLRPYIDESSQFHDSDNLFIEGDNLDALKLLQESYLSKVKMIYIDPPYNTGNDFIYNDDFKEDKVSHDLKTGKRDIEGNILFSADRWMHNSDANGRFHSDWLSMMLPRLKLARNLLKDDGVIFISIGDDEVANLKSLCNEVFGENNFEGHIHWRRRHNQPNDKTKMIGLVAEHIICYSKDKIALKSSGVGKVGLTGSFSNPDKDPRGNWASKPWKVGSDQNGSKYEIQTPTGKTLNGEWMGEINTYQELLADNRIYFPDKGNGSPRKKYYESERKDEGQCATNWWSHELFGHNQEGNEVLTKLMDDIKNTFSNPKPPRLIKNLMAIANCKENDIVMDFFLGSGSSFHAACEYEAKLKFIGVQLPEPLSVDKKEQKPGYDFCVKNGLKPNIAEVSKERIRRVARLGRKTGGFRVLKIDSSNMTDVYYNPDQVSQADMFAQVDNIKEDRTGEDILFQVLLDWGVGLTLPINQQQISDKDVFFVNADEDGEGADLIACFATNISDDLVKQLAELQPLRVVFRDDGFANDAVKINVEQIFKQVSPGTDVKSI